MRPHKFRVEGVCVYYIFTHYNRRAVYQRMMLFKDVNVIQCVPEKRKPINQVNFSENCNDLSEKVYTVTKFSLSSFF